MRGLVPLSRRGFLKVGVAGAAGAVVLGVAGRFLLGGGDYEEIAGGERPRVLSVQELAVLTMLADTVVSPADKAVNVIDTRTAARIDLELSKAGGRIVDDVKSALKLIEYGPVLDLKLNRFTNLTREERALYIEGLSRSSKPMFRSAYTGLRTLCMIFYYTDPRAWRRIGYGGPLVETKFYPGGNRIENLIAEAKA